MNFPTKLERLYLNFLIFVTLRENLEGEKPNLIVRTYPASVFAQVPPQASEA